MKILNKTISSGLAILMIMSSAFPVSAESTPSKEEVIYIMTGADGSVDGVYAVNIFGKGDVTDYGNYTDVKLLNSNCSITADGDKITFSSENEKTYCQGTLENAEIPWNISIKYFIDGNEFSAEEMAGKSGNLEIKFKVEKNEKCKSNFYDNYALQASFSLDTNICKNITANDATIANVGSNKQLSYTILPGQGIDTSITADVENFEMPAASINGIKMNLDIDVDKSELTDKVTELNDGIGKIDNGANELSDGTNKLKNGGSSLKDGSSELSDGSESLDSGIDKLADGVLTIQSGLYELSSQSDNLTSGSSQMKSALGQIQSSLKSVSSDTETLKKLTAASGEIKSAISKLKSGAEELQNNISFSGFKSAMSANGLDIDALTAGNSQAIDTLTAQISQLNETVAQLQGVPGYEDQAASLQAQVDQLYQVIQLLGGNNAAIYGTEQYLSELSKGADQLISGLDQLEKSYGEFDKSINSLVDTLSSVLVNVSKLSDGIDMLSAQYDTLDGGIKSYTAGVDKILNGYNQLTNGISDIATGSKALVSGSKSLNNGASDLYDGIIALCDGAAELSDGTGELKSKTSGIDTKIEDKIDDVISSIKGDNSKTVSFTSDKNTSVESVQFVIKTEAIKIPEVEEEETVEEEEKGFWQKLTGLFGF